MMTRLRKTLPSVLLLACLPCAAAAAESAAPPVTVLRPEKGFIDDAYAVTADNSTLIYVNTDGANWAKLRAIGLPASAATPATAPTTSSPPAAPPPAAAPFSVPAGQSIEIIGKLPLSVTKLYLLPEDRVLVVSRDTETGGVFNGNVYNLKSRTEVTIPGGIGPASDITVGDSGSGPLVVAITRPGERSPEYKLQAFSARNLKPVASKTWKLEDGEPRITTALGIAMPLYFLDDYLTLATKHNGTFDKKKDLRQPDFLAFIDTLTGKIKSQRPMASPTPLLDLARLRKDHGESVLLVADETTQSLQLLAALPRGPEGGPTELKTALTWPRPASMYEPDESALAAGAARSTAGVRDARSGKRAGGGKQARRPGRLRCLRCGPKWQRTRSGTAPVDAARQQAPAQLDGICARTTGGATQAQRLLARRH
jgi:hypothetical protein